MSIRLAIRRSPALQCVLAIGAFLPVLAAVIIQWNNTRMFGSEMSGSFDIAIEHTQPLSLAVEMSSLRPAAPAAQNQPERKAAMLRLSHDAKETVPISLPSTWRRTEVSGVPLDTVTADESTMGFTRWMLPPGSKVTFLLDEDPPSLKILNPSEVPMKVEITRIDAQTEAINHDVVLVKESPATLWNDGTMP